MLFEVSKIGVLAKLTFRSYYDIGGTVAASLLHPQPMACFCREDPHLLFASDRVYCEYARVVCGVTSRMVVSTLPHRHDLPRCHHINQEAEVVNCYIEELYAVILDFNQISRSVFKSHELHLKQSSKHLLAELLIDCMRRINRPNLRTPPQIPATTAEPPPA
ncbi:hypothetical protein J6590_033976 [Homalodisca vitripennis]|nr:hypothetical protein J6590_033976 [Homalodisca vitripennis]